VVSGWLSVVGSRGSTSRSQAVVTQLWAGLKKLETHTVIVLDQEKFCGPNSTELVFSWFECMYLGTLFFEVKS
jgi:hypothetical protein